MVKQVVDLQFHHQLLQHLLAAVAGLDLDLDQQQLQLLDQQAVVQQQLDHQDKQLKQQLNINVLKISN
jgi:hypothetical protein